MTKNNNGILEIRDARRMLLCIEEYLVVSGHPKATTQALKQRIIDAVRKIR